jgi:hypothetical protein
MLPIVAGILVARHLKTPDDLFGGPQGSPRTDAMIAAAVQRQGFDVRPCQHRLLPTLCLNRELLALP